MSKSQKKITTEINRLWNHEPYIKKYKYTKYSKKKQRTNSY